MMTARKILQAIYGEHWAITAARQLGVSHQFIYQLATGKAPIPRRVMRAWLAGMTDRLEHMERHARADLEARRRAWQERKETVATAALWIRGELERRKRERKPDGRRGRRKGIASG